MHKRLPFLVVCALIAISCSKHSPNRISTNSFTAANEVELQDGRNRVNGFKQELISRGFQAIPTTSSSPWEQVGLKGDYGELKDVKITLYISKQLDMREPHLKGSVQAHVGNNAAEQEFKNLDARLQSAIQGR